MKTAVIYARYSSDKQTEQSIEGQLHICYDYAKRNDITVVNEYIDRAMTGTNDNRKAFQQMLKDSNKKAWDYVLVYKLDRFSRNKYETAIHKKTLRDNGVKLLSAMENIPDTPEGIILESLLEGMAEYYSAELSQKVKRGMRETRQKGYFTGGQMLYGYKADGKRIAVDPDQAEIVRYIFNEYAKGETVKDIIADLTRKGILNKGKKFNEKMVYCMIKNERYSGTYHCNGEEYPNTYPRIVPQDIIELVNQRNMDNRYGKQSTEVTYYFRNRIRCGYCGKPIISECGTSSTGILKRYYKCNGKKTGNGCKKSQVRKEVLEQLVFDTTYEILNDTDNLIKIADLVLAHRKENPLENSELNLLIQEQKETQKQIDNFLQAIAEGIITPSTKVKLNELERKLEQINLNINEIEIKTKREITKHDILQYMKKALDKDPRLMAKTLINHIVLYDDKIEIHYNYVKGSGSDDNHRSLLFISIKKTISLTNYRHNHHRELNFDIEIWL
ncbi:MAG: recombinase family protein [Clostridia bacterium]|nr:recombinase family protein [Clostridia bacterium]